MTFYHILAILGALAWLPHFVSFIKNWVTKPQIRIITHIFPEIGFSVLGPIFNMRMAFSVKNKDIVITGIKVIVKHESGYKTEFLWQGITQQLLQMRSPDAETIPFEKEQSVLAIKLTPREVEERFIQFQNPQYLEKRKELDDKGLKKLIFLKGTNAYEPDNFVNSEEMKDMYSFIKQSFNWKTGQYSVSFELDSPEKFELLDHQYTFSLNPMDIEALENNKELIEVYYKNIFISPNEVKETPPIEWNWRNPILTKTT